MTTELHMLIRQKMRDCGVWNHCMNMQIYTCEEFIKEFGHLMPEDLIKLLADNVGRLQSYLDDRILEPIK